MPTERVKVAQGVELAVHRWDGDGTPFLLVHGLASNARMWDGVADRLAAHGHPVVALDLRGHGRSDKPAGGYDFETITDDLRAVVEDLSLDRPVAVGQSWGGNLVVELAHRFPALTRGIACVDGGLIELSERFPDWDECARVLAPPRLVGTPHDEVERYVRSAHPDWPETGIAGVLANFEVRADGTVAPWLTVDRHMAILRGLWEHRPSSHLDGLAIPLLLMPADTGDPAWTADKQAAIDRAVSVASIVRVRWFAPADHDIHAQHPAELAGVLHDATTDGFFS
jgi:pimeloyl-ACP methyl ester carboxylesterase